MHTLLKIWGLWSFAGMIVFCITVLYVYATEGFIWTMVELIYGLVFAILIPPLDLVALWVINPLSLIFQLIFQGIIFFIFLWLRKKSLNE